MNKRLTVILAILVLVSPLIPTVASASTASIFTANVQTSSYVYTGQAFNVYVNSSYGFSNYTISVYFGCENATGLTPQSSFFDSSSTNGNFVVDVTAPTTPQDLYMYINVTAQSGSATYKFVDQYMIQVVNPIYLNALVKNTADVPIYNISVQFTVDGIPVKSILISNISADSSYMVNYTWGALLKNGEHTLTVSVNNPLITVNGGTSVSSSRFYYGHPPNYNWILYVVAAVGIFMAFMVMGAGRRARTPRRPKWKK